MSKSKPPIVIVAFNRPRSLSRLLCSVSKAHYPNKDILLIISIDKSDDNDDVLEIANNFEWNFGTKEVKYNKINLGLRKHVLQCGELSQQYDSVIVLEDDLYVSPNFYEFTLAALQFSSDKAYIGGISLYNHQYNVHNRANFSAIEDGFDNWYFQFASSWGQAWSKIQWKKFIEWYQLNQKLRYDTSIPLNVSNWSDKSWLKYYITYLIKEKKYFFYPKVSLTTNFSDAGTHVGDDSTAYQVPLDFSNKSNFIFSELKDSQSKYDAFYENTSLYKYLDISDKNISIDLNGYKEQIDKQFLLSSKKLDFKILKSFGKSLKPIDANVIENIAGTDILLYDTSVACKNSFKKNNRRNILYNIKYISETDSKFMFWTLFKSRIIRYYKTIFKR